LSAKREHTKSVNILRYLIFIVTGRLRSICLTYSITNHAQIYNLIIVP